MQTTIKITLTCLCLLFAMAGISTHSLAQETPAEETWYIQTSDGNEFEGTITEETSEYILLQTKKFGEVKINKNMIDTRVRASTLEQINSDQPSNRMTHRYFLNNSGFGLQKGQAVYSNYLLFFNQIDYGFTDRISAALGLFPLFLFGAEETPFWYALRYNQPLANDKVRLGVRLQGAGVIGAGDGFDPFNFLSFTGTFGQPDRNVSVGLGYGIVDGQLVEIPLISLSGMYRVGKKNYLLLESFITTDQFGSGTGLLSFGARHVGKSVSIDYGLIMPVFDGGVDFAFPLLGVNVPIGKK